VALWVADAAHAAEHLSFLSPQGSVAAAQREHFWMVARILIVLVALPVFVGTVWIAWRHRYGVIRPKYTPR
jgi:cytochrome o ubiquinol oxidase subunit 2